ncbi:phage terminase large subunit family protein [Cereibacter johrii]|uniref:phage terminase large subunit family protein n=1 Tax=Cereibacter johrii TaxID=445629 RepID=UPI000847622C|nr:phage terminase large subunit family protein [Cereibacter johrii]ODM42841.1 terminase [Cereibacter johrii]
MVEMLDRGIGRLTRIPPLPPFTAPEEILADALPLLDPPSRVTVTEAAERHMRVPVQGNWVPFDRAVTPYTVEPADMTQSRRFKAVVFLGPSQSGKSQMMQSVSAHAVTCAPGPVQVIHMTKTDADAWVEEKLDPTILNSPALRERLGTGRDDSTFSRKRFKGMRLTIGYPVPTQLSSRSQRLVMLTDYDHMPQKLGPKDSPEGSPFGMALQRIRTFMSRGCVLAESSPAFPVDPNADWAPHAGHPHMLPPATAGLVPIYNEGTRGRWYWECPDCGDLFEPRFDRLHYDADLDPGAAGEQAMMECPHCGTLIAHRHKVGLNRAALEGRGGWLHEGRHIDANGRRALVRIDDPDIRRTPIASYSLNGAAAAFASWEELVQRYETERRRFEALGDDTDFARVHYTDIGVPYRRPEAEEEGALTAAQIREHMRSQERRVAPAWTRFVTVSIDVQGNRFEVLVMAWGAQGERMPIDRFAVAQPPDHAPRAKGDDGRYRALDPGRYVEDADALLDLPERLYPVEGASWSLKPCALVIDFNGPAGWSDNAEKFWRARRRDGQGGLWWLSIGRGGFQQRDRVWHEAPERGSKGRRARGIKLLNMATDRMKESVLAAVGRFEGGQGAQHVPSWLEAEHLDELLAERRGPKGYEKRQGAARNETLDLSVQALAVAEFKGLNRIDWQAPPAWAEAGPANPFAVAVSAAAAEAAPAPRRRARTSRSRYMEGS